MKKLAFALVGLGLLLIAIFVWADSLGLGGDRGMGGTQLFGIQVGVALVLCGIGVLTVDWGEGTDFRQRFKFKGIPYMPVLFWALATFMVVYVCFFLLPVFFSRLQIHYLTRYIPDAFITHIGFDIEAVVSRIETWLMTGQSPYADGFIGYPPLAIAVFSTFTIIGYPAYFKLMAGMTVLAYLSAALILPWALVPKRNRTLLILLFITGLFSYGLQFEQERGQFNLIAFAFTLFAIYIFHVHPKFRFFAYLLFSLSIQLKVYPVFFVLMFVDDWRDWRDIARRFLGLGLVNFGLLFVLGHKLFLDFLRAITSYQLVESSRVENLSIKGFAYYLSHEAFGQADWFASTGTTELFFWLLLGLCFLAVIGHAILNKRRGLNFYLLLVCTVAALIIPSISNDYKLSLLIPAMVLGFCSVPELGNSRRKTVSTLLVILASLAYWTTLYPAAVKPEFLGRNFPALIVILISVTILNFLAPYSYEGTVQGTNHTPESIQ